MKKANIIFSEGRLSVIEKTSVSIFCYTDIVGIFCDHPYLMIETINKEKKIIFHSLKEISQLLPFPFVMCSRSAIINMDYINNVKTQNPNSFIYLKNGQKILIPRRKKGEIMRIIKENLTV
jgi:DNA-binding LytR/AlgR family response regulator